MASSVDAVEQELSAVGAAAGARLLELTRDIWRLLTDDIPELRGDHIVEALLEASIEENVTTLLHVFEHGTAAENVDAPAAAIEYAKRLAQRGVPITALIRAYRVGHGRFLARCVDEITAKALPTELAGAVSARMVEVSFRYIDRISEQVITTYQRERDRWLLTQTAVRAARVRELLASEPVDIDACEVSLGYRLRQHHLGIIAWVTGETHGSDGLDRLERLGSAAGRQLGALGRPLFVPRDEALAWIWLPVGDDPTRSRMLPVNTFDNGDVSVRVAVGEAAFGVDGFRRTHLQAGRAQDLALAAQPGDRVTSFADVGAVALICADVPAARSWVCCARPSGSSSRPAATSRPPSVWSSTRTASNTVFVRPSRHSARPSKIAEPTSSWRCAPVTISAGPSCGPSPVSSADRPALTSREQPARPRTPDGGSRRSRRSTRTLPRSHPRARPPPRA